ncbi:MAG: NAD-binding protein [Pseudonocardiaceae bacterium]
MWRRLGVEVTVVEALPRLAPFEEPEVGRAIAEAFTGEGIGVVT